MKPVNMKKKTLLILGCLVSGNALACDNPQVEVPKSETTPVLERQVLSQDEIMQEMKKRGIVSELPGLMMPLVNYGTLAKELKNAGQSDENVIFVVQNVKEAFDVYSLEELSKRNLTDILDEMGILERDAVSKTGTICM
ncbi:MAG: hypothetical protein ACJAS4_001897 [Bacteriovoracaceae bacterium]|jgi:hypothetical protein